MGKSPFTEKELEQYQQMLVEKKGRLLKELQEQSEEVSVQSVETGDLADLATELLEKELNLSLSESEKDVLKDINDALDRIRDGVYGICIDTGEPIAKARLDAIPEARRSLAAQEKFDKLQKDKKRQLQSQYNASLGQ